MRITKFAPCWVFASMFATLTLPSLAQAQEGQWSYDDATSIINAIEATANHRDTPQNCKTILQNSAAGLKTARDTEGGHLVEVDEPELRRRSERVAPPRAQIVISTYLQPPRSTLTITYDDDGISVEVDWLHSVIHEGLHATYSLRYYVDAAYEGNARDDASLCHGLVDRPPKPIPIV